ncbi:hypothetical protein [Ensifer adhaerens]|uniref:hypothetical protein n=1 Tax=Ensifer adhaerens TaxID=106592 RepID=UPI001C4DFC64|nr:hypothetical protein [Ensifer adhaerens]MBW0365213.1 hypothetical protein [Ensifer adhaerens]UCM24057.1 hypothetical protein LDL63_30340 [Ensifer adhaerens]
MKIAIAVLASLAFATTVNAYVPSTPVEKKPIAKTGEIELAAGGGARPYCNEQGRPLVQGSRED